MKGRIRYCPIDQTYILSEICPRCGHPTVTPHPARYSPQDRYGRQRRMARNYFESHKPR
ncbi:MAG: RNA-protein complex protein Nop10 [Methanospirillum sp.]|nr:RNA-protein complex protein Nop10 [Methanospirillum sp.]